MRPPAWLLTLGLAAALVAPLAAWAQLPTPSDSTELQTAEPDLRDSLSSSMPQRETSFLQDSLRQDTVKMQTPRVRRATDSTRMDTTGLAMAQDTMPPSDRPWSKRNPAWPKPTHALRYSLILPGLGQAYNHSWWKVPIATGAVGTAIFFVVRNQRLYKDARDRFRADPDNLTAQANRDAYLQNRDLSILLGGLAYTLVAIEAYVHAHLMDFEISDDLALRMQPGLVPDRAFLSQRGLAAGGTLAVVF